MIRKLPIETLIQVYRDSLKYALDREFIELLEQELFRRKALNASMLEGLPAERDAERAI
ncbi:sporulation histidine kinase inhibitor Sda [Paenibacillus sp.]|uniref:sporulation histidine kinase inhibitor Sda n=1 Tax=Paenibacillus sp. TaxID=58172 RepID=UPI002D730928|nr:sporulation histidine kinase inhibitor Sda [Paenibacillus sp.]HZG83568.1 sporulation histidine kinase inhibitor Sda [Paenibacillus sp.]